MGSTRFIGVGIGKVHWWWVRQGGGLVFGSYVVCGMSFQQIWRPTFYSPPHFLISLSLSWDWIWRGSEADLGFILFVSYFWQIWKTHLLYVLRRDILGLWVCERTIYSVCWERILWVCGFVKGLFAVCVEKGSSRFVKGSLLGLWMRIC